MKQPGEDLESTSTTLPECRRKIALVYNIKQEAPSAVAATALQLPSPAPAEISASVPPNNVIAPGVQASVAFPARVNDMFAEWDTMETIDAVRRALEERHDVVMIEANELAFDRLTEEKPEFVFNIAEGLHGVSREAQMPAIFELLRIPYLGSDPLTLAVCLDKSRAKEILAYHKLPTAPFTVIHDLGEFEDVRVRFPSIVKPLHEGSSKGIYNACVVRDTDQLFNEVSTILEVYRQPALVEEFLLGREFTVAIMGNGADLRVLPIVEIKFDALPPEMNPIYSYEAKWILDTSDNPLDIFECPASIDDMLREEITRISCQAYRLLRCRDWSRIDVRLDGRGRPNILEINPLPGILPKPEDNSCFPKAARAAGMTYSQLINSVLDLAMERCGFELPKTDRNWGENRPGKG